MRTFDDKKLVIATHNKGKLAEFQKLLNPFAIEVVSAGDLNLPEPEENGKSFKQNALIKARAAVEASGLPSLADDSGLCVYELNHQPGIYSARWCGEDNDPMVGMSRVNEELADAEDRSAYFVCALALAWPDGHVENFEGKCFGFIVWPPRGDQGHGYDPFFVPEDGDGRSFGEMSGGEKDEVSHRANAMKELIQIFKPNEQ